MSNNGDAGSPAPRRYPFLRYRWGQGQSLRGVNPMRVSDGRIVEAKGYVKGA